MFQGMKYFAFMLEGREFVCYTDHKPLTFALTKSAAKSNPRQARQLDFISQFTSDIRHVPGKDNVTADILSRISAITRPFDLRQLAEDQTSDDELKKLSILFH